jgi:hypothetical protein
MTEAGTVTMTDWGLAYSQNQINLSKWEERPILFHCNVLIQSQLINEIWLFEPTKHRR